MASTPIAMASTVASVIATVVSEIPTFTLKSDAEIHVSET